MEKDCYDQDRYLEDEVVDTLSLSDLLIYDNNGDPQDFYTQNPNLEADDQFEFSSELLKLSTSNSVVFCGKIIPYKEATSVSVNTHKQEIKKQQKQKRRWRLVSFFRKSKAKLDQDQGIDLKYEVPIRRVSILASVRKPRWYFFISGFGSSRFQVKMHIRDLKKRQTSMSTKSSGGDNKISDRNGGGIGPWKLVRLLGCGGGSHHLPNAIAKIK